MSEWEDRWCDLGRLDFARFFPMGTHDLVRWFRAIFERRGSEK